MQAYLFQSGPHASIYLLAKGNNRPAEEFLTTVADDHPEEFAKLISLLDHSCTPFGFGMLTESSSAPTVS